MATVGERIKTIRLKKGMTLEEVGAKLGVVKTTINKYESGSISRIPYDRILALADALNVDPSTFFMDEEVQIKATSEELDIINALRLHPEFKDAIKAMLGISK